VLTSSPGPNLPDADTALPISIGNQDIVSNDPGQHANPPQESSDYFSFPDIFAIRVDPTIVNQTIDQLLAGLDAIIPDQLDVESLSVRLGYWVVAVSATAVSWELVRQDLRARQKARAEIRLLSAPMREDFR
jgi:hypothetical protein